MQEEDFVVFKVDMTYAFNLVSRQAVLDECSAFPQKSCPGCLGVMALTQNCGILWAI